ncbi:OST-HTH/LOTUS domain-containing protein [Actinoplanes sp. NPDC026623]|uniref:OST-HTH/LOTUS domain-containing protein n=1 Tax=Actinoplanes sp. NPDC026623 TaxID=3155610 RepID=UPI0033D8BEE0
MPTRLVRQLRAAVEAASDDDGWAALAHVGHLLITKSPDFDPRSWGHPKLSDLVKATGLFDSERRKTPSGDCRRRLYPRPATTVRHTVFGAVVCGQRSCTRGTPPRVRSCLWGDAPGRHVLDR